MKKKEYTHTFSSFKLPCGGKLIYLLLISCADKSSEVRDMPLRNMSASLGISQSCVSRNLKRLRRGGYLSVQPQYKENGMRTVNVYRLKDLR